MSAAACLSALRDCVGHDHCRRGLPLPTEWVSLYWLVCWATVVWSVHGSGAVVMHPSCLWLTQPYFMVGVLLLLPGATLAHGNHASIVHLITLHVLPWISDQPYLVALLVCVYFAFLWYAYRRLLARETAEESVSRFDPACALFCLRLGSGFGSFCYASSHG